MSQEQHAFDRKALELYVSTVCPKQAHSKSFKLQVLMEYCWVVNQQLVCLRFGITVWGLGSGFRV